MTQKKRGLGRGLGELGLDELLSQASSSDVAVAVAPAAIVAASDVAMDDNQVQALALDVLGPGRYQPRKRFAQEALTELADSIRAQGVIQPIIVRSTNPGKYEIVAGERRWRAAQLAGLKTIPAIVRDIPDATAMAFALIENIQRQDLNVIEEAVAMQRLIEEFNMTHQQVADVVGKSRAAVSNLLRLLNLKPTVRELLEQGALEMGHARALLSLEGTQQAELAEKIATQRLSVRETEALVRRLHHPEKSAALTSKTMPLDVNLKKLQLDLSEKFAAKVKLSHNDQGKGKLVISYNSLDELEGIITQMQ